MDKETKLKWLRIALSAVLFAAGLLLPASLLRTSLLFIAFLLCGFDVFREAFQGILNGEWFDECFLMSIGSIGAFVIGEYAEAAAVLFLFQVGEFLEELALDQTRTSVTDLVNLRSEIVRVVRGGTTAEVKPDEVSVGEQILVVKGEKIPLDGEVTEGVAVLDTSALTGESVPVDAAKGDGVLSGSVVSDGMLSICVSKTYENSAASRILRLIEESESGKSKAEGYVTRFSRVYTPIVCILAVLLFLIPSLFDGQWQVWGYRALCFLVVSCPCALVISVPLAFFCGIGAAGRNGILIKSSTVLEAMSDPCAVVFDKTGTLTEGVFAVSAIHPEKIPEDELLCLAAAVECASVHPIAKSIWQHDRHRHSPVELTDVQEILGQGVSATWKGHRVSVGNQTLMDSLGIAISECPHNGPVVHISCDETYMGHIGVSDRIKRTSPDAVLLLKRLGVRNVIMLTGDREEIAGEVSGKLGVDGYRAGLLPEDKVDAVKLLQQNAPANKPVVFVGDGLNDAPVLVQADIGIAMGGLGSNAAIEAADIVLTDDDPEKVAMAVRLSRRIMKAVRENIAFILISKAVILLLSALGVSGMWVSVLGDVGVCLLAILNAIRVRFFREKR